MKQTIKEAAREQFISIIIVMEPIHVQNVNIASTVMDITRPLIAVNVVQMNLKKDLLLAQTGRQSNLRG